MKCLLDGCENEFENKTGRRRFCSDACKMKWHRRHPKKNVATKFDIQVLLNESKAAIQEMKQMASDLLMVNKARMDGKPITNLRPDAPMKVIPVEDEPLSFGNINSKSNYEYHLSKISKLVFPDDKSEYMGIIKADETLSEKEQKELIMSLKF